MSSADAVNTAFAVEVERAWNALVRTQCHPITGKAPQWTFYLTERDRIVWGRPAAQASGRLFEIGTFTFAIQLSEFRDEAFGVYDSTHRAKGKHGRR